MTNNSSRIRATVVSLLATAGMFFGIFIWQHMNPHKKIDPARFNGTYLQNPRAVNPFSLMGTDNKVFNNESLKGHWTLMFFGFTRCGYLCPTTMAELAKMYRTLEKKGVTELPQVVMVSVDPQRDSLEKMRYYVKAFHKNFYGSRGDEAQVNAMTREMGVAFSKVPNKSSSNPEDYDVEHSGAIIVFNPKGELNAFFTTPHHADVLAKDYLMLIS